MIAQHSHIFIHNELPDTENLTIQVRYILEEEERAQYQREAEEEENARRLNQSDAPATLSITPENIANTIAAEAQERQSPPHSDSEVPPTPPPDRNVHLVNQANAWIAEFYDKERDGWPMPPLTESRRISITKGLNGLFNNTLIHLLKEYLPHELNDDEKSKLDGVILKINSLLCTHCYNCLNIKPEKMHQKKQSKKHSTDPR
jgi:hypothetical protein